MDPCSDVANHQSSKLDEFVLVSRRIRKAGRGAYSSSPTVRKNSPTANGSLVFASPEFREAPSKLSAPFPGGAIGKERGIASSFQAILTTFSDQSRLQNQGKEAQASPTRSDGDDEPRGAPPQRTASPLAPLDAETRIRESRPESSGIMRTHLVPPNGDSSFPRKSNSFSVLAGPEKSSEGSETTVARQTKRNDLSVAKAKAPKARNTQRKNSSNSPITSSPHSLIEQPGTGTGAASPEGEAAQGPSPSPIDYNLEVEAVFSMDLVSRMKESAAKKARRTVIGRTLGGRATLKSLSDCLKLHLPVPLVSINLLTRGYFEIMFEEEEGAKATRRLAAVEWSGLSLSFSRYAPNFDASSQGAEAHLTHAIKVQFPDLHEEFKNTTALTLMASKLEEVLEIKAADSYIKRPTGPMITIELKDISKLPGYIRIPLMAEGTDDTTTIAQKILYSGLLNQCRRCRRFGHHARACITSRNKPWEGTPASNPANFKGAHGKVPEGAGVP
ncbi:unnamed protein product [Sphagnum jensenii]